MVAAAALRRWAAWAAAVAVLAAGAGCRDEGGRGRSSGAGIRVEPAALDFGPAALGHAKAVTLTLHNTGRAPVTVESIASSLPNVQVAGFAPVRVEGASQVQLEVSFTPVAEGAVSGQLSLHTDAASDGEPVPVQGRGVRALVQLGAAALAFGNVSLGQVEVRDLTLHNPTDVEARALLSFVGDDLDAFSSSAALAAGLAVAAGETKTVQVAFAPTRLGEARASLRVVPCQGCEAQPVALTGAGVAGALEVSPLRLEFGRVALGATAEQAVTVRNNGTQPFAYEGARVLDDASGTFRVTSSPALVNGTLQPGAAVQVRVAFAPTVLGPAAPARLEVLVRPVGSSAPGPKVSLLGEGGNSCVTVMPRSLDFGDVAEGMSATRRVQVLNRCGHDALVSDLALATRAGGFFGLTQAASTLAVPAGGSADVGVSFTPRAGSGTSQADLTFRVTANGALSTERVEVRGTARAFQACSYALEPAGGLDFGRAQVGSAVELSLGLRNTGSTDCYVAGMGLAAGTDGAFRAQAHPGGVLPPGRVAYLRVRFSPDTEGDFAGLAEAWVNHPTAGRPTAALAGQGVRGCLTLQPATVDFGVQRLDCGARERDVVAVNACAGPVTLDALAQEGSAAFSLPGAPAFPATVPAAGQLRLRVRYAPVTESEDVGALRVATGTGAPYTVGLAGAGRSRPEQTDRFQQESETKVDLLFVVDNSGSMKEEQDSLGANFQALLQAAQDTGVDYHIGVTTTGLTPSTGGWSACPGGADGGENGRLFPANGQSPRVITRDTPNAPAAFRFNTSVGVCHWDEQGLEAAYRALSDPLLYGADDPRTALPGDGNGAFLRQDAKLAVVFVTDEEDFSPRPVDFYESYFRALKGNDPARLSVSAIAGPADLGTCPTASSTGSRYLQLARATGGAAESICTPNWAESLRNLSENAFGARRNFPLTRQPADAAEVRVAVDGTPVTAGWEYQAATNAVVFTQDAAPRPGAVIEVTYPLGCEP